HIPFCHHICPYCGFYKHKPGKLANAAFIEAILLEATKRKPESAKPFRTVFFGGGTPSLLSHTHLTSLCQGLAGIFDLSKVTEWTLEANPATYDHDKAALMLDLGINRISLGVQSFQAETLKTLGRDHTPDAAVSAFETLRKAGFKNVSIDLMFSIPGQNLSSWQADLKQALALKPDHVSAYNLTYEEDTEFLTRHEGGELDSDEDRDADLFYEAIDTLEAAAFSQYEISNYARPGFESLHNQAYWAGADYLGLGPGAVSTLGMERSTGLADTAAYVKAAHAGLDTRREIEVLTAEDKRLERLALQLRTREGIPLDILPTPNPVESLIQQGLVRVENGRLKLSRDGKALADPVSAALV
ncbi:MAG: radical SAM family heme chaperone HemW, partial [Verrucomicrobiales bacterium]|nr:radical SAM family heme chaperone HemW [Verrucomicrobiales bacterium]